MDIANQKEGACVSWCVSVIRHAAAHAKRRKSRFSRETAVAEPSIHSSQFTISTIVEWDDIFRQFTTQQLTIFFLIDFFGYSQREVADALQLSQQQVSRLHKKVIEMLRNEWASE